MRQSVFINLQQMTITQIPMQSETRLAYPGTKLEHGILHILLLRFLRQLCLQKRQRDTLPVCKGLADGDQLAAFFPNGNFIVSGFAG